MSKRKKVLSAKTTGENGPSKIIVDNSAQARTKKTVEKSVKKPVKVFDGGQGELDAALRFADDVLNRSAIPFFVLGETARQMVEDNRLHQLPVITLGIQDKHWAKSCRSTFKMVMKEFKTDYKVRGNKISFSYGGVPVTVQIIKVHHKYFDYCDTVFYYFDEYRIPNSFKKYWQIRHLVR